MLCVIYLRTLLNSERIAVHRNFEWARLGSNIMIFIGINYCLFMVMIDVPMYIRQGNEDLKKGMIFNTSYDGLFLSMTCSKVDKRWSEWREEATWQTPYFTVMVW